MIKGLFKALGLDAQKKLISGFVHSLSDEEKKLYSENYLDLLIDEFLTCVSHEKRIEIGTKVLLFTEEKDKSLYVPLLKAMTTHLATVLTDKDKKELKKLI